MHAPGYSRVLLNEGDMTYYYGVNKGQSEYDIVTSTSATTSRDVEIVVNNTNITSRADLLSALEKLENAIIKGNYPL